MLGPKMNRKYKCITVTNEIVVAVCVDGAATLAGALRAQITIARLSQ